MKNKKKFLGGVVTVFILTACASAPKPAECNGEFKPVNPLEQKGVSLVKSGKLVSCIEGVTHG